MTGIERTPNALPIHESFGSSIRGQFLNFLSPITAQILRSQSPHRVQNPILLFCRRRTIAENSSSAGGDPEYDGAGHDCCVPWHI